MENMNVLKRPNTKNVKVIGGFWGNYLKKTKATTVPDMLMKFEKHKIKTIAEGRQEEFKNNEEQGFVKNFEWLINGEKGSHVGDPWFDGLVYETIRGVSDIIAIDNDKELEDKIDFYIDLISKAQDKDENGYINTYTDLVVPNNRFGENGGNLLLQHDVYNMGALIEAGIHYYTATGKTKLLKCAVKGANYLSDYMGESPKKNIIPAHSLPEEAMVKLYRLFADEKDLNQKLKSEYGISAKTEDYLRLVKFWIEHRGVYQDRPFTMSIPGEYAQDHKPVREQTEAVGHAVRATLFYLGIAALTAETNEDDYKKILLTLWDDAVNKKMSISGGVGAIHHGEKFGKQYELPNNSYLETCAAVGLAFWAGEMHRIFHEGKYFDVFERALYNNILAGLSHDGTQYFYQNPLRSNGTIERFGWTGCPCCPPMLLKIIASLPNYIYSYDKDNIYINLHIGSQVELDTLDGVKITQSDCTLPWDGSNKITINCNNSIKFKLFIRKPEWAENFKVTLNGNAIDHNEESGYIVVERSFNDGDTFVINMDLPIRKMYAHPLLQSENERVNHTSIAIERGPILYCVEGCDNDNINFTISKNSNLNIKENSNFFDDAVVITGSKTDGDLFQAVPYYLWNNRGKCQMKVWMELEGYCSNADNLDGWEDKLYKAK